MDKIYTRKRIRLPSIRYVGGLNRKNNFKTKITFNAIIILIIALITLGLEIKAISPILDRVCSDTAKAKAMLISNNKATEVMKNYTYSDFVKIYKDSQGNITMLQSNIITINEVTSDVAEKIQLALMDDDESMTEVKLRKLNRNENFIRDWTRYSNKICKYWVC